MAFLKWLGGAVIGLLLMLALAVILIPMLVDPNDYRDDISRLVEEQTGRTLRLDGDLKISVFPWLGIETQQIALSQPAEIGGEMVAMDKAQLRLKLMPLLNKQLEIDTIVLERPTLNLITLENGVSSFTGLAGDDSQTSQPTASEGASSAKGASTAKGSSTSSNPDQPRSDAEVANSAAVALVIQGIEISDANVVWDDRSAGQKYQVQDFNLTTGNLLGSELAPLEMSGTVIDAANPVPIQLKAEGLAKIDRKTLVTDLASLQASLEQGEQRLSLTSESIRVEQGEQVSAVNLALQAQLQMANEDPQQPPQSVRIDSAIDNVDYRFSGPITASNLDINGQVAERDFVVNVPSMNADLEQQTAAIKQMKLTSGDLALALSNIAVAKLIDAPSVTGKLELSPFNAAALLRDLAIDYQPSGERALQNVGLDTSFSASADTASLRNLLLNLDQSTLRGNLTVSDFETLAAEFDLVLDDLILDDYLPVASEDEAAKVESAGALAVPLAALRAVNANGSFKANTLVSGGLKLQDIDVVVASQDGQVTVTPKAKLYDGTLGGEFAFRDTGEQASLRVQNEIDLVSLGNMLTDAEITDQLTGLGSLFVDVVVTEEGGVQRSEGVIKLVARNGAVKGVDIKKMIESAYATYQRFTGDTAESEVQESGEVAAQTLDETRFAELLGTFNLKDNLLSNNDFSLKAPLFRVSGEGEFDLAAQTVNYLLKVAVVGSTDGQGGKALQELSGITIPIRLRGALSAPSYSLDMKSLYQSYAKRELDKKKGELLQRELGVEGGENMSTKEILKGALLNRLNKDKKKDEQSSAQPAGTGAQNSQPVPYEETGEQNSQPVPYEDTGQSASEPETPAEPTRKELREERKRRLLESILGSDN